MAIAFNCPHCQHQYRVMDHLAGRTATCKTCRQKITIPNPLSRTTPRPTTLSHPQFPTDSNVCQKLEKLGVVTEALRAMWSAG
jgi:hypothetical protein